MNLTRRVAMAPTRWASARASRGRRAIIPRRQAGQSLVEFSLVIPTFLVLLMGVIEFSFLLNGLLSINYASRDAALVAAEAGNEVGADCVILRKVIDDVTAPANQANITQIQIYWTNATGQPLDTSGNVTTFGDASQAVNTYVPGSTTCTFADGTSLTVPFSLSGTANYPEAARCNAILGTAAGCLAGHTGLDTIGVQVDYLHTWRTPLHNLIGLMGTGASLRQSNQMRMEPVL